MVRTFVVKKSSNKRKKWQVREELPEEEEKNNTNLDESEKEKPKKRAYKKKNVGKLIYFGQEGYRDFTLLYPEKPDEAEKIKKIYINRHKRIEHWDDPNTAGFWAKNMLWNKPTMEESARDIEEKFGYIVKLDI